MSFFSRYSARNIFTNKDDNYRRVFFENRGIKETMQYETAVLDYPTNEELAAFQNVSHFWTATDKLWKLSSQYYGTPGMWWVIAWYNAIPIEADVVTGDLIEIPINLASVLDILNLGY